MGISWKAMPLLSTLAALVIIVHSAEEDFEPDYRELRPRRMETATLSYDQPWRMYEMEPVATESTQPDWDVSHQEEPPKHRRPIRKRKRRPPPISEEDLIPQEIHLYREEYRSHQHEQFTPHAGVVRRRRKQFDSRQPERPNAWAEETIDADRPLVRKRGHKRKRPQVQEPWPELSEFNVQTPDQNTEEHVDETSIPTEATNYEENRNNDNVGNTFLQNDDTVIKTDFEDRTQNKIRETNYHDEYSRFPVADNTDSSSDDNQDDKDDKSLSEFSSEIPSEEIISTREKHTEKSLSTPKNEDKKEENEHLDPQTLKEILKKSNGRSLSEILQQHNLSLVDLLHGKEKALSILKMEENKSDDDDTLKEPLISNSKEINEIQKSSKENKRFENRHVDQKPKESIRNAIVIKSVGKEQMLLSNERSNVTERSPESKATKPYQNDNPEEIPKDQENLQVNEDVTEATTKSSVRRRFPVGIRKRVRMRPMNNTSYKSQLSRDLIALTSRRYQLSRNSSRHKDWKDMLPTMVKVNRKEETSTSKNKVMTNDITTTTTVPEEITVQQYYEESKAISLPGADSEPPTTTNVPTTISADPTTETMSMPDTTETENIPTTSTSTTTIVPAIITTTRSTTEKPLEKQFLQSTVKTSDLRRQAFNNRLKRKRLKQKTTTTEPTQDNVMKDIFGMANLVSASEFIAKIQPRTTSSDDEQDFTTLEDFMTTEPSIKTQTKRKSTKGPRAKYSTTHAPIPVQDMEETAKIEIEEILNDTLTSARLSKILMERNMTINELVEHRERGSSHIHLADIFHNASREPNPPEPFLSKSLIEPISKETYPLRALLEANLHDPTAKATTIDPNSTQAHYLNIPIVMDFGNNVNENGENMGIMSLFNNFTKNPKVDNENELNVQTTEKSLFDLDNNNHYKHGNSRESRTFNTDKDLISWKEIIAIMHRGQNNNTNEVVELTTKEISPSHTIKKIILDEDLDGDNDGLTVINDLERLKPLDYNQASSTSDEKFEIHMQENAELPQIHVGLNKSSNSAKSVTVATASILGLAMVLFLLTYVAFRWKQQRNLFREKPSTRTSRIPSPVFENRKGHKNNSSTRSKSPMISSSNIYTIDTLDKRNGNESPEYMWDTLRKPFQ